MNTLRVVTLVILGCIARPAAAQLVVEAPAVESALMVEISLFKTQLAKQIKEIAALTTIIENCRSMLRTSNQIAALARNAKRAYDVLRRYSMADFVTDARRGLYAAFPEIRALEREMGLTIKNAQGIENGTFFAMRDYHDSQVKGALIASARYGWRASIWPSVFPKTEEYTRDVSEAERLAIWHFRRLGFAKRRAIEQAGTAALTQQIGALVKEAENKQRVDFALAAATAQASAQTMANTQLLRDAKETQIAEREAARLKVQGADRRFVEQVRKEGTGLFEIGTVE